MSDVILAILVFSPLVFTFLLKSNSALAFLALCAGFAAISFTNIDIQDLTKDLSFHLSSSAFSLALLIGPFVLTLLLTPKAFSGKGRLLLQSAAALCGGALLALVAIPLLSEAARLNFAHSAGWDALQKAQTPIVAVGAGLSLFLVWFGKKSEKPSKKHK